MVKVQVSSHYQCVGGGYVSGKTKRSGDWGKEEQIISQQNIERQQFSQPTKEMANARPRGLRIWYSMFDSPACSFIFRLVSINLLYSGSLYPYYCIELNFSWYGVRKSDWYVIQGT
jgi:hypothetical protein